MTGERARLTITDVVYLLMALAGLAALFPVYQSLLDSLAPELGRGPELLFATVLPVAALMLLAVVYVEARKGRPR